MSGGRICVVLLRACSPSTRPVRRRDPRQAQGEATDSKSNLPE